MPRTRASFLKLVILGMCVGLITTCKYSNLILDIKCTLGLSCTSINRHLNLGLDPLGFYFLFRIDPNFFVLFPNSDLSDNLGRFLVFTNKRS